MKRHVGAAALIVAAVVAVYANSLGNGFVWDDHIYVEANPFLRDPANIRFLLDPRLLARLHGVLAPSRPVFLASLFVDKALWGLQPWGYHLTNILLHAAVSVWVYALAWELAAAWPLCLLSGLVFAVHPALSEAVDGICFRTDLLAAFFALAALWTYLKARRAPGRASLLLPASAALFGLGLLSKEMAASLPALVLLAELYFPDGLPGRARRLAWAMGLYALVLAAFALFWAPRFRYSALGEAPAIRAGLDRLAAKVPEAATAGGAGAPAGPGRVHVFAPSSSEWEGLYRDRGAWFWTTARSFAGYFRLMVLPDSLTVDRAPAPARGWRERGALPSLALLAFLAAYGVAMRRRHPVSAFGAAWCLAALAPVSGIVPIYNPVAERYLYLVLPGAAMAMASGFAALAGLRPRWGEKAAAALAVLLLLAYAGQTWARNRDWESDESLFLYSEPRAPQNSGASLLRGSLLRRQGLAQDAAREYEQALRQNPRSAEALLGLGMACGELGRREEAAGYFEKALELAPKNIVLQFSYAWFLDHTGDVEGAVRRYRSAVELDPGYVEAWVNLGALYRDSGRARESEDCYKRAVSLSPQDPVPYYSYAMLLEKTGRRAGAEKLYAEALKRDPAYAPARARLGLLRAKPGRAGRGRGAAVRRR